MVHLVSLPFLLILKHILTIFLDEGTINKPDSPWVYIPPTNFG